MKRGIIIQIADEPIEQENYVAVADLPKKDFGVYHIGRVTPSKNREEDIAMFQEELLKKAELYAAIIGIIAYEESNITAYSKDEIAEAIKATDSTIVVVDKKLWFAAGYYRFMCILNGLSQITLDDFASEKPVQAWEYTPIMGYLHSLRSAYDAIGGVFVWWHETFIPLSRWLKWCDCGKVYYIGGVLDWRHETARQALRRQGL